MAYDLKKATEAFMSEMDDRGLLHDIDDDVKAEIKEELVRSALNAAFSAGYGKAQGDRSRSLKDRS